jgi:hypothetical protein
MIEVPMQHSEDLIEEEDAQEINPIDVSSTELNPVFAENPENPEINPENPVEENEIVKTAPKKRGRPRKAAAPPPTPSPVKVPKAKAAPKAKVVRAPPKERARALPEEESYPMASAIDSISSTELVAELLSRRAVADRDRTRQMYRSWLS